MSGEGTGLAGTLYGQLRADETTELDLVRTMNAVIAHSAPHTEDFIRFRVLLCMAGALRRTIDRRRLAALTTFRFRTAWQMHEALWDVTDFAMAIQGGRGADPDRDYIQTQVLQLALERRTDGWRVHRAVRAMLRVASAGTTPVH
ncbi:hypothetical protein [Arthrobacter sp. IK3]|uniref:hypothetical protein n=1 Tax=Arthrobacter sp. IK3 TaxID=3448169 RepID=UPI003EE0F7F8